MGDPKPPTKSKELTLSSVKCPMLTALNYTIWSMTMKMILRVHEVWEAIDPGTTDAKKNDIATVVLFQAIPENLILQVGNLDSPKAIWDAIKVRNLGADRVREARLQTLMTEFNRMSMTESESVDTIAGKISEIAAKAATLDEIFEESKMGKKFLQSLPEKFIHMVASIEQLLDLNKTGYEDIVGRFKAYEERIKKKASHNDTQQDLLFTESGDNQARYESSRGRGRTCRGYRGRGRGIYNSQERTANQSLESKDKKDKPAVICYRCDKPGHFASTCP